MTRIISGLARGARLEVPKSGTRPTSDRVREALFSSLESWGVLGGAAVLDLFAGSGALGLEAVSRGAAHADFVEKHPGSARVTAKNLGTLGRALAGTDPLPRLRLHRQSAQAYLESMPAGPLWDIVFIDPPYDFDETALAQLLAALTPRLAPDGVIMVERSSRSPEPGWPAGLEPFRSKRYGETMIWWAEPS